MVQWKKPVKLSDNIIDRRGDPKRLPELERLLQQMLKMRPAGRGNPNLRNKIP